MIQEFVQKFDANRERLLAEFRAAHPADYQDIVRRVITVVSEEEDYGVPDPERITVIDHGHYQGTLFFVIAGKGYQPHDYWYVIVDYGSCSGCDTFDSIREYGDDPPTEEQAKEYLTLALHILQGLKQA